MDPSTVELLQWVALPGIFAGGLIGMFVAICQGGMAKLSKAYPGVQPVPGTELRSCSRIVVGVTRMSGGIMRIGSDDTHLHVRPCRMLDDHDIGGASIPWTAIDQATVQRFGVRYGEELTRLRLTNGTKLIVPTWTLEGHLSAGAIA